MGHGAPDLAMQTTYTTDQPDDLPVPWAERLCTGAALLVLLALFVTVEPFSDLGDPKALEISSGNEAVTYIVLFILVGISGALLHWTRSLPFPALATRENLALLAWLLVVSVAMSTDSGVSAKRFLLSSATYLLAAMLPWLTRGLREFTSLLLFTTALVLVMSYAGVAVVPHLTIHQATDVWEPEIAGDWRGIYGHKNVAAGVMAAFVYIGWFVARTRSLVAGLLISAGAFVFLVFSGGKSATGMVLIVGAIAYFVDRTQSLWGKALVALGPLAGLAFLTVGSITSETARSLLAMLPIDVTFTGRTEIWSFAIDALKANPWKGHGFEAFWYSEAVRFGAEDSTRWMVEVSTSHNSYVDLALTIGLPGLALVMVAFIAVPLRDFHNRLDTDENIDLSRLFLVLWLFCLYLGTFEAFFLSRANQLWFILALAVCGLRYTALFKVKA